MELPKSLDETYLRILNEISEANRELAHRLLQCLTVAVRPLLVEELAEVLAVDFDAEGTPILNPDLRWEGQEDAVFVACSTLVAVVDDDDTRVVQFSHFSVKEFLTSDRLATSNGHVSRYHIPLDSAHTTLAQTCFAVLLQLDEHVDRDSIESFPLAKYAADYWVKHVKFENVLPRIEDGIKCLFDKDKPHYAAWLWIHHDFKLPVLAMTPERPQVAPLYYAALQGFSQIVEYLLTKHPEDVNARGGRWVTPLHAALRENHDEVARILIPHADLSAKDDYK
jgi:Ankyrin repeats (3 copies)